MIGCVLLAGGKSSRMNGIDKALVSMFEGLQIRKSNQIRE